VGFTRSRSGPSRRRSSNSPSSKVKTSGRMPSIWPLWLSPFLPCRFGPIRVGGDMEAKTGWQLERGNLIGGHPRDHRHASPHVLRRCFRARRRRPSPERKHGPESGTALRCRATLGDRRPQDKVGRAKKGIDCLGACLRPVGAATSPPRCFHRLSFVISRLGQKLSPCVSQPHLAALLSYLR